MVCILYIYIISDIQILCTFFCYFSGIFFRYICYFAKNVNFPKKFFVLGFISWYILEIPRRTLLGFSVGMTGFEVFFVFTFSRGIYWRFLVAHFIRSVGMAMLVECSRSSFFPRPFGIDTSNPSSLGMISPSGQWRTDVRIYSI